MSLRQKALVLLGVVLVLAAGIAGWFVRTLVLAHTSLLERQETLHHVETLETILQREQETLQQIAADWSTRDGLYGYMTADFSERKAFEKSQFHDGIFQNNRLHLVLVLHEDHHIQFARLLCHPSGQSFSLGYEVSRLLARLQTTGKVRQSGFLQLSRGVFLMATSPITTTDGKSPSRGTLLVGRFFYSEEARELSRHTGLNVSFWPLPQENAEISPILQRLSSDRHPVIFPPGDHTIYGFTLVRDLFRTPVLLFRVGLPRTLHQKSLQDLRYFAGAGVAGGLLLLLVILGLVDRLVGRRLAVMADHIARIDTLDHLALRIPHEGHDELARVAQAVNRMLEALEGARQAEQATHRRFQTLVANTPGVVYRSLPDDRWTKVYLSDQFTAITGYAVEDFLENRRFSMTDIILPEDLATAAATAVQHLAQGRAYDIRFRIRTADGAVRWLNDRGQYLRDSEDGTLWIDGVFMDITDFMSSMEQLRHSEILHRMIFENSGTALAVWERGGPLLRVNEEFCHLTGFDRSQVEGLRHWESFFPVDTPPRTEEAGLPENAHSPRRYEARILDRQGNAHDVVVTVDLFPDGMRHVGSLLDVSEARRARKALELSERRYREMADALPQPLFEVDTTGRFLFTNQAGLEHFGFREEDLRRGISIFDVIAPDDRPRLRENFQKTVADQFFSVQEYQALRKDGSQFPIVVYARPILQENAVEGLRGLVVDISERKTMEEQLRFMSMHDPLTRLYNRAFFDEECIRMASGRFDPLGVVVADLDGLKLVNDLLGHSAGDRLLREAGRLLRGAFRSSDVVARVGGDEFTALLPECGEGFAQEARRRVLDAVERFNELPEHIPLSISVGCASGRGKASGLSSLLAEADNLMYQQKHIQSPRARDRLLQTLLELFARKTPDTSREEDMMGALLSSGAFSGTERSWGALLARYHDLGYVGLREESWRSPEPFSEETWRDLRRHPEIGYRIALACPDLAVAADAILCHHERPDGTGYPRGLQGEEIPPVNRLFAVVDAYAAMTRPRPGRPLRPPEDALEELRRGAGSQFDTASVELFLTVFPEGDEGVGQGSSSPKAI